MPGRVSNVDPVKSARLHLGMGEKLEPPHVGCYGSKGGEPSDVGRYGSEGIGGGLEFLLWQLADSAFPTGGFAHSAGLEAAWQHGEVRNRADLLAFLETNLRQLGRVALPFVNTAYHEPGRLVELDELCDAFLTNHVTNRASRLQGRAFLTAVERVFLEGGGKGDPMHASRVRVGGGDELPAGIGTHGRDARATTTTFAHFAPVFGACLRRLEVPMETSTRLFFFNHLRAILASAVRLNIVGPMEAQVLQHRLATLAEEMAVRSAAYTLDDLAQTAPLLDLWQGAQDRLYSRLFQS